MKSWKILAVLAVVGSIAFGAFWLLHRSAKLDRLALINAEQSYLSTFADSLQKQPRPEAASSASVFLSANAVNSVLAGADQFSLNAPHASGAALKIITMRTAFRDGFPEVLANIQIVSLQPDVQLNAKLHAALEPRVDKASPTTLLLKVHPLSIDADAEILKGVKISSKQLNRLLADVLKSYADLIPEITIPLSRDISIAFPAAHVPLQIPTQHGRLNGEIDLPALSTQTSVIVSGVYFLSDGVHVLLGVGDPGKISLPYKIGPSSAASDSGGNIDSIIQEKSKQIDSLRESLQPKLVPLKVPESDFRVWISKDLLSQMTNTFNALSTSARTIHYHTISEEGQIYQTGGGGLGCGGYANLVGGNSAQGDLQVSNFSVGWSPQGLTASADFNFSFNAQVTGHVNGPAGPHPTWVLNCIHLPWPINKDVCTNLPSATISCETPVGGGLGLGSYGIHGQRTEKLTAAINLHSDESSWLLYDAAIVSPDQIPITIEVGLGQLGTAGFPINFPVPHQPLLTGKAPSVFGQEGQLQMPQTKSKGYTLTATPQKSSLDETGYAATGKIDLKWNRLP